MIIDLGAAAAPYVLVFRDGVVLSFVVSIDTGTRSVKRHRSAADLDIEEVIYDDLVCTEEAPSFVRLIPGMRTVRDLESMLTTHFMPQFPIKRLAISALAGLSDEILSVLGVPQEFP